MKKISGFYPDISGLLSEPDNPDKNRNPDKNFFFMQISQSFLNGNATILADS